MRLFPPLPIFARGVLPFLLVAACADWQGLYGVDCHGEWIELESECAPLPICGDSQVDAEEECDDGNTDDEDGCSSSCEFEPNVGGTSGAGGEPQLGGEPVEGPMCGDGTLDEGEICDDGDSDNDDSCLAGCNWASCGDGVLRKGVEECDDGNLLNGDGCAKSCLARVAGDHFIGGSDHTYRYHDEALTFDEASEACGREGGYLWVTNVVSEIRGVERNLAPDLQEVWIGLRNTEGTHGWITGATSTHRSWIEGEPGIGDCVVQYAAGVDLENFKTLACDEPRPFICEHESALIEPITHHAYRRWMMKLTHEEAVDYCKQEGGTLASLETAEEAGFFGNAFRAPTWVHATRADGGQFEWGSDGASIPWENLEIAAEEQDDSACLYQAGGALIPCPCDETRVFVCEFD